MRASSSGTQAIKAVMATKPNVPRQLIGGVFLMAWLVVWFAEAFGWVAHPADAGPLHNWLPLMLGMFLFAPDAAGALVTVMKYLRGGAK